MPFQVACDDCGKAYVLPDDRAGKRAKCKRCGHVFRLDRPVEAEPVGGDGWGEPEPDDYRLKGEVELDDWAQLQAAAAVGAEPIFAPVVAAVRVGRPWTGGGAGWLDGLGPVGRWIGRQPIEDRVVIGTLLAAVPFAVASLSGPTAAEWGIWMSPAVGAVLLGRRVGGGGLALPPGAGWAAGAVGGAGMDRGRGCAGGVPADAVRRAAGGAPPGGDGGRVAAGVGRVGQGVRGRVREAVAGVPGVLVRARAVPVEAGRVDDARVGGQAPVVCQSRRDADRTPLHGPGGAVPHPGHVRAAAAGGRGRTRRSRRSIRTGGGTSTCRPGSPTGRRE